MIAGLTAAVLFTAAVCFAGGDEIELKDGTVLKGDVIAQNSLQIYLSTKKEGVVRVDVSKIRQIRFGPKPPEKLASLARGKQGGAPGKAKALPANPAPS